MSKYRIRQIAFVGYFLGNINHVSFMLYNEYLYLDHFPYVGKILKISINDTKYNCFSIALLLIFWFIQSQLLNSGPAPA